MKNPAATSVGARVGRGDLAASRRLLAMLGLVVACAVGWFAPPARAASASADSNITTVDTTSGPVTLFGWVVDRAGQPVSGATVSAKLSGLTRNATTGADGNYAIPNQARGIIQLTASRIGYGSDSRIVQIGGPTAAQHFRLLPAIAAPTPEPVSPGQVLPEPLRYRSSVTRAGRLLAFDGNKLSANFGFRRDLPTVVLTHGWILCLASTENPATNGANGWPLDFARRMSQSGLTPDKANLVAWDWYDVARFCPPPEGDTPEQGLALGSALYETLGSSYRQPIQFMGHSLGTLVNSYAVDYLHGTPRSEHPVANPRWDPDLTQVTLFDEASMAKLLAEESLRAGAIGLLLGPKGALVRYLGEASQWKNPVPGDFAFLDNYISCVGRYHNEGVNVLLQRPIWGPALDFNVSPLELASSIFAAHSEHTSWYAQTIGGSPAGFVGWKASVGHRVASGLPSVPQFDQGQLRQGGLWRQRPTGGDHDLELGSPAEAVVPPAAVGLVLFGGRFAGQTLVTAITVASDFGKLVLSGAEGAIYWMGDQVADGAIWAAGKARSAGKVVVEVVDDLGDAAGAGLKWAADRVQGGGGAILDLSNRGLLVVRLSTGPPPIGAQLHGAGALTNTPAYLWLPVVVPAEAQWMSFQFRVEGEGRSDALVFGIDGTNRFTLPTRFIGRDTVERSGLINVSDLAGRKVELFFGVVGGSSTNCMLTVSGIEFRSFAVPELTIQRENAGLELSWPSSAPDWRLESSVTLDGEDWQVIGIQPALFAGRLRVTLPTSDAMQFFRLREAQ